MKVRLLRVFAVLLATTPAVGFTPALAEQYILQEVMSGLVTPRGLAFGPDGGLYVAEAGSGGAGPSIVLGNGNTAFLGATSGLSRLLGGVQTRVLNNLPSVATSAGLDAGGLQDIAFDGTGQAYGLFGLGSNPSQRNNNLGAAGAELGTIVRLSLDGSGVRQHVADVSQHEATNPDGGGVDSNPFGMAMTASGHFVVADAGANDFLQATSGGVVSTLGVLPAKPNPLPFGPPVYQSVPTTIAIGPDDTYYIGQLTGFPFPPGAANIYRFDPATSALTVAYSGFTNIVDLTFDQDGMLYVLQVSGNGLASPSGPGSGLLLKIDPTTGLRTTIASDGLVFPGGVVAGPDGTLYVTNHSNAPTGGQVLSITVVPEPSSLVLLGAGMLVSVVGYRWSRLRERRSRSRADKVHLENRGVRVTLLLTIILISAVPVRADQIFDWSGAAQLHPGVQWHQLDVTSPRNLTINALRVDTHAPGVKFYSTPRISSWSANSRETQKQTTRDFIRQSHSEGRPLVAAVNADFWTPFPASDQTPANLRGLAVSDSVLVSPAAGTPSLLVRDSGQVTLATTASGTTLGDIDTAVSGNFFVLIAGSAIGGGGDVHPRSGMGVSADGQYLYLLALDGRRWSSQGGTLGDVGQWLKYFGAHNGMNTDGGGSTTMAWWDPNVDDAQLLNVPNSIDLVNLADPAGSMQTEFDYFQNGLLPNERAVGNNFGIYFVAVPEPAAWLLALAGVVAFPVSIAPRHSFSSRREAL